MRISTVKSGGGRGFSTFKSTLTDVIDCAWYALRNTFTVIAVAKRDALLARLGGFQQCWSLMNTQGKLEFVSSHSGKAMLSNYDLAVCHYDLNYGLPSTLRPLCHSMRLAIARAQGGQASVDAVDEYVQCVSDHLLMQ